MASRTKPETAQQRYETGGGSWDRSVLSTLADAAPAPIGRAEVEAFAADPGADLYVVEVFPADAVTNDVEALREDYGLNVQLVGVGESEPDGYPGAFIEADRDALSDPESVVMRAVPSADLLVMSPGIEYAGVATRMVERCEPRAAAVNPGGGGVVDVVESALLLTNDADDADDVCGDSRQFSLDAFASATGDAAQLSLRSAFARA
ncbi:hypothetical protein C478_07487 [Natrinema thermotolerans DSM 11552]|nr:hypothetical protein C478_07487 [Natrinema thermotolerans DSM 11552]